MSDEINREAEELLKEALAEVKFDVTGEVCPQGDECAVHFRNDEEIIDEETEFGRLITYTGEYVVITSDNPDLEDPKYLIQLLASAITGQDPKDLPELYDTSVLCVGDGALADLRELSREDQLNCFRFIQKHDSWDNFKTAHQAIVDAVKDGMIDLSQPVRPAK